MAVTGFSLPARAGCTYGDQTKSASVAGGVTDSSHYYTVTGNAVLTVSGAAAKNGAPIDLNVSFSPGCKVKKGATIACTVKNLKKNTQVRFVINNPSKNKSQVANYKYICTSL